MAFNNNIFCKGILCNRWERKYKCVDCGVNLCGVCVMTSMADKKDRCPNCYIKTFSPDWDKMNKEFDEMFINKNSNNLNEKFKSDA